ncbi:MAG: hypothetical protein KKA84_10840 [Bacteroidetes bacterium]|nr:hypothetical protein [Bacteroidota bacterium]
MNGANDDLGNSQIINYLKSLDNRISNIENKLNIYSELKDEQVSDTSIGEDTPNLVELNLGEHWFANIGILILTFGFMLLLTLKYESYGSFIPSTGGYVITAIFFLLANILKVNYSLVSKQLFASGFALFYLTTLRLFHFTSEPFLSNVILESILLIGVASIGLFIAYRRDSNYLFGLNLGLLILTGLIINTPFLFYSLCIVGSGLFLYRFTKNTSTSFILFGIAFVFLAIMFWTINNPFITGEIKVGEFASTNIWFAILVCIIFSFSNIFHRYEEGETERSVVISLLNGFFAFALSIVNIVSNPDMDLMKYLISLFVLFLLIAVLHWKYGSDQYSKAIYAIIGYAALSIGIIFTTGIPDAYIFLIWQSLLVIGTGIMFKSKNIIVANFLIFLLVFVAYLASVTSFSIIGVSFGIVALTSARALNWQKDRLTLKTEMMRNTYLIVAFFSIPITLIEALPLELAGLFLIGVTIIYYVLSIVLKNAKYRWMAHFSLIFAIIYSAYAGLKEFDSTWTVITFLALGIVLIAVSILFTKNKQKTTGSKIQE